MTRFIYHIWTVFLCCVTVLVKDWHWRSHLGIGLAYKLKSPASAPKYPCALLIRKNGSLGELGHQRFLAFLVKDYICYIFAIVIRLSLEKIMCLNFARERIQKCDKENRECRWRQIKSMYRLYLDLVVTKLNYINCLNGWATKATNCATFRN